MRDIDDFENPLGLSDDRLQELFRFVNEKVDLAALREQKCPTCGKRTVVMAMAWKGGGIGSSDSVWEPTAYERVTPEVFCTCPGGPAHPDTPPLPGEVYGD